jgi:hypothetical protein
LVPELLLKGSFLFIVNDRNQHFIDKPQVVTAHEYVIGVIDSFNKRLEQA